MKKIVILDFDGTIADTKPVILNTFHRKIGRASCRERV